jgi:TatD DNase family protein
MVLTDTHTHIYYHEGEALKEQIQRCLEHGIARLFLPNVDSSSVPNVLQAVHSFPDHCFAMMGLHPCSVNEDFRTELEMIRKVIVEHPVYAIGEIGLDLYWDKSTLELQKEAFRIQAGWASDRDLPVVIHCRDAFDELFALLDELQKLNLRGIFHCFTGNYEQAQRAISLGFSLGIGGVVTYKNAGLDQVVAQLDSSHIVLETDAPYLAPVPYRGKRNESSYLRFIAERVAEIKALPLQELAEITTRNSKNIFGI